MNDFRYGIVNLIRVAQSFPAAPRIMAQLGPLLRDPAAALGEIASHLKHDSALSARLLRIANSAAFAQGEPVASIEDAAALIGLRDIHRLVGVVAVDHFSQHNYPLYGFTGARLRDNAILGALLMEELAVAVGEDAPAAYTAGLFRSIGKLALAKIAEEHTPVAPYRPTDISPLVGWERDTFGLASNQATAAILREWHFPGAVTQAIEDHYHPATHHHPLAGLLNHAGSLAEKLGHGLPGESRYWLEPAASIGLGPDRIDQAVGRAVAAFDRINGTMLQRVA